MTQMTAEREKILKKVQKLLNLANKAQNPNENEANEALLKAQRMMAENGIATADLDFVTAPAKKETGEVGTDWMKKQWYHRAVADVIASNFRCYYWFRPSNGMSKIVFFGLKADAELCKTMYDFALIALDYNAEEYIKARREVEYIRNAAPLKTDYMKGFIRGLYEKFKAQQETKVTQVVEGKQIETSMALVLVKDNAVVQAYENISKGFKKAAASKGGRNSAGDGAAYAAGKEKGKNFEAASGFIG